MTGIVRLPQPGQHPHHHHHSVADAAFAAMGWAYLLRGSGISSWRHPLRDLAITASSLVVAPGALILLGELGWPASGWNVLIGIAVFIWLNTIPTRLDRREDARWLQANIAVERTYRREYTEKLATVCSPAELGLLEPLWDVPERTYEQDDFWSALARRWFDANPTRYPSQDQARAGGLLCVCEPGRGHTCLRRSDTINLVRAEAALARIPGAGGRTRTVAQTVTFALAASFPNQGKGSAKAGGLRWLVVYLFAGVAGFGLLIVFAALSG